MQLLESAIDKLAVGKTTRDVWLKVAPRLTENVRALSLYALKVERYVNQRDPVELQRRCAAIHDLLGHFNEFLKQKTGR